LRRFLWNGGSRKGASFLFIWYVFMYHLEDIVFQLVHADLVVETLVGILISA
jgi:hypothetical protein